MPFGEAEAERDADAAADQAERDRFDEELQQHVAALGADRHAQADLARPLGDRHQHDVHDADAADDERDAGDAGEQRGHRAHRLRADVGDFLERPDDEVVVLPGHDLVPRAEQHGDLVGDGARLVRRRRRHRDVLDVGDAEQLFHHRRVGREDLIVHVGAHAALAFGRHDADDLEGLIADPDDLTDRVGVGAEQRVVDGLAEHGDLGGAGDVLRAEESADSRRPRADQRQVDVGPLNAREPVLVAGDHLCLRLMPAARYCDAGDFVADRVGIVDGQRAGGARRRRARRPARSCRR